MLVIVVQRHFLIGTNHQQCCESHFLSFINQEVVVVALNLFWLLGGGNENAVILMKTMMGNENNNVGTDATPGKENTKRKDCIQGGISLGCHR